MIGTNPSRYLGIRKAVPQKIILKNIFNTTASANPKSKRYMQTKAFWNDNHNKKMAEISDMMMNYRDRLTLRAKNLSDTYRQNIDGTLTKKPRKQEYAWVTAENQIYNSYKKTLKHYSEKIRTLIGKQKSS